MQPVGAQQAPVVTPGYVLCGGQSQRMGRDKALLRPDPAGPTLAESVAAVLHQAGLQPVRLVGSQPDLQALSWPVLRDPLGAGHHPLFGFAAALGDAAKQGARFAIVVPCDVPALRSETVMAIARCIGPAVAECDGHIQPMFAKLSVDWAQAALAAARSGWSARRFLDRPEVARVRLTASALSDLDTPDDFAKWMRGRTRGQ